jgi:pyrroloquinoline quinone biosynthesis protein D
MQNTTIDLQSRPALAASARLQIDPVDGGPVLLYPEGLLKLNETAHDILCRCDGRATVGDIIALLAAEYEAGADALREDVIDCLARFYQRQLVVFTA